MSKAKQYQPPVTTALRRILFGLGYIDRIDHMAFSDSRQNNTAVGVKFVDLKLTEEQINIVTMLMENRGYEHLYTRFNNRNSTHPVYVRSIYPGTRFCYKKV